MGGGKAYTFYLMHTCILAVKTLAFKSTAAGSQSLTQPMAARFYLATWSMFALSCTNAIPVRINIFPLADMQSRITTELSNIKGSVSSISERLQTLEEKVEGITRYTAVPSSSFSTPTSSQASCPSCESSGGSTC